MFYNQQSATTSEICLTESVTGAFCSEKEIVSVVTYHYFDFIIYFIVAILPLVAIAFFKRKK